MPWSDMYDSNIIINSSSVELVITIKIPATYMRTYDSFSKYSFSVPSPLRNHRLALRVGR
jgi:hypothetical protein